MYLLLVISVIISAVCLCAVIFGGNKTSKANALEMEQLRKEANNLSLKQMEIMAQNMEFLRQQQEALKADSELMKRENRDSITALLSPLRQQLQGFENTVKQVYENESAKRSELSGQIQQLMQLNQTLGKEANALVSALRADPQKQGAWGETVLETLLEQAGMQKGIHFTVQQSRDSSGKVLTSEEGEGRRTDVVINLPDGKHLVIDSKVSLNAFLDYSAIAADDNDPRKKAAADRHLTSVRNHIRTINHKQYQKVIDMACDQVLMFMPIENAYLLAMRLDPTLWQYAFDRNVAIVSPSHLFSVVQLITQIWRQDKQNKSVIEIANRAGKLYDKLAICLERMDKLGKELQSAGEAYDDLRKSFNEGQGNLVWQVEELKALGAKTSKVISNS